MPHANLHQIWRTSCNCHYVPELTISRELETTRDQDLSNYPAFLSDAIIWNAVQGLVRNFWRQQRPPGA